MPKYLTVKDVAEMLQVKERTVYSWIESGKLAAIKLPGGDLRFKTEHVENWINRREIKATA